MNPDKGRKRPSGRPEKKARQRLRERQEKGRGTSEATEKVEIQATSSFSAPRPSHASVETMIVRSNKDKEPAPIFWSWLLGLVGLFGLIVLDGLESQFALAYVVLLSGLWAIFRPPASGIFRPLDFFALALFLFPLLSMLPQFYWPDAEWRTHLSETVGMDLPASLAIQPWTSFEIWVQIGAGLMWFYVASTWPLNYTGRKWLYVGFSVLLSALGIAIMWGLLQGGSIIGSFHIIQDEAFNLALMSSGAVLCFAFMMGSSRGRDLAPFIGIFGTAIALGVLYASGSGLGLLLFLVGALIWYVWKLLSGEAGKFIKVCFPILLLASGYLVLENEGLEIKPSAFYSGASGESVSRSGSAVEMFLDAPLTGVGLGNFATLLPQYEHVDVSASAPIKPANDLLLLSAEGGLIGVVIVLGFIATYLFLFRKGTSSNTSKMRGPARIALCVFALAVLIDTPAHNMGAVFYGLLLMTLALPRLSSSTKGLKLPRFLLRGAGVLYVLAGLVWLVAVTLQLPLTTAIAEKQFQDEVTEAKAEEAYSRAFDLMDSRLKKQPLGVEVHFMKGALMLGQEDRKEEAQDAFGKAAASAPFDGGIPLEAGILWSEHDIDHTIESWSIALERGFDDLGGAVQKMVETARGKTRLKRKLPELSEQHPEYRAVFFQNLEGRTLVRAIEKHLREDPGFASFSREDRTAVVMNWVNQGGGEKAGTFLNRYADSIDYEWLARSVIAKDRADFVTAVNVIRANVEGPTLPGSGLKIESLVRAQREFAVDTRDLARGGSLLRYYIQTEDYQSASEIAERLLDAPNAPDSILYWKAEALYHLEDYIESWFTFQLYVERSLFGAGK